MRAEWALRPGRPADLYAVLALERATPEAPHWSEADYLETVLPGGSGGAVRRQLIVAETEASLIGFVVGGVLFTELRGEIESVAVADSARRMGVGRALCTAVLAWCRETGARRVELEVRAGSGGAIALYGGLGFEVVGRRPGYYAQPREDALVMSVVF